MSKTRTNKKIILSALFVALAVAMGYAFVLVPNVEMITATVFIAGMIVGPIYGIIVGFTAEFIFSLLNPLGAAAPPLLIAQVLSFSLIGLVGGLVGMPRTTKMWRHTVLYGCCGFGLTMVYDILTTLSFAVFAVDGDMRKILTIFATGFVFYLAHSAVNTVIFATIVPLLVLGIYHYQTNKSHA